MNSKILAIFFSMCILCSGCMPVFADDEIADTVAVEETETEIAPDQAIQNEKGFVGVNYNRQDSKKTGKQRIVNDHSFFNININIIKEGALFKTKDAEL